MVDHWSEENTTHVTKVCGTRKERANASASYDYGIDCINTIIISINYVHLYQLCMNSING